MNFLRSKMTIWIYVLYVFYQFFWNFDFDFKYTSRITIYADHRDAAIKLAFQMTNKPLLGNNGKKYFNFSIKFRLYILKRFLLYSKNFKTVNIFILLYSIFTISSFFWYFDSKSSVWS